MTSNYDLYNQFLLEHVLAPFYNDRFEKLRSLALNEVLKSKNPYLAKAKNIAIASELVRSIVDAFLSSREETTFGNLLERFAIYVSHVVDGGFKSDFKSVDLEFQRDGTYYIVSIKSGPNWANADQIAAMKNHFEKARQQLRQRGIENIIAVNGCMYGTEPHPFKGTRGVGRQRTVEEPDRQYYKYAGQDFWHFISKDENLYQEIIRPFDQEARKKGDDFKALYDNKINLMTIEFSANFLTSDGQIDWLKLVDFVSKRSPLSKPPL